MKLITVTEAAKKLGVSRQVIEYWGKEGVVDIKKVSKSKNSSWVDKEAIDIIGSKMVDIEHSKTMLNNEHEKQKELLKQEKEVTNDIRRALSLIRISGGICLHKDFYLTIPRMLEEIGILVPREAQIMREIIGGEDTGYIAERYGLTRSRVLQIFSNGCRKAAELNGIREIIDNEAFLKTEVERLNNELADLRKFANSAVQELKKYKKSITDAQIEEIDETLKLLNTPIKEYYHKLSIRTQNCLKAADVETIGNLIQYNKTDILKFRNFGKKSLIELEEFVEELGLEFGTDIEKLKRERMMMYVSNDSEC